MAILRRLSAAPIGGFASDGTFELEASTALVLGDSGLEMVALARAREGGADVVAVFEPETTATGAVWRVFDHTLEIRVQGARLGQVPFAIVGDSDVISRGPRLRLRFESPFVPVSFGGFSPPAPYSQGTLLNPLIGTAPFLFRSAVEEAGEVHLLSTSYGRTGMELHPAPHAWRLCTLAEANAAQGGGVPEDIATALGVALLQVQKSGGQPRTLEEWAIGRDGRVLAYGTAAERPQQILPERLEVADLVVQLCGKSPLRDEHGAYVWAREDNASPLWRCLETATAQTPEGWVEALAALPQATPPAVANWAAALLPEVTAAQDTAMEQIEMMRPLELMKLRLQAVAANSRAAI